MEYKFTTRSVLHQLGVGKSYSGFSYILYAIELIDRDISFLDGITKILYIDIAKEFQTSHTCVERNIRKVIDVIWNQPEINKALILKIFGRRFLSRKPSNKEFLELLYEYIKSHKMLENLLQTEKIICPISNEVCTAYTKIIEKLIDLK